jgi:hypothetical protein
MCEIKRVKAKELFDLIQELLSQEGKAWLTVTGMSMYPFLRENKDAVELAKTSLEAIKKNDIVLIRRKTGEYILHRVLYKREAVFYIIGDAQRWVEGPISAEQLLAKVESVKRSGRIIKCEATAWKLITRIWLFLIPIRPLLIRGIGWIGVAKRHINSIREVKRLKNSG